MTLVGWSDAAYGDQSTLSKRRPGYVIGLMSATLRRPCPKIHWASKFARDSVESSLGWEMHAFSAMLDHMPMLQEFYAHSLDPAQRMVGLEDRETLLTHLKNRKIPTE